MKKTVLISICVFMLTTIYVCFAAEGNPENGKKLFSDPKLAGSQNDTACIKCHPGKDAFQSISINSDLNKIINMCITKPLAGNALENDSQDMKDLKTYILSQSK
ncbi:MAG: hypothetical protein K9K37_13470 [Desulfocapsa sp.]|nr:hypothetical protein [Desulfocapsa sp.]